MTKSDERAPRAPRSGKGRKSKAASDQEQMTAGAVVVVAEPGAEETEFDAKTEIKEQDDVEMELPVLPLRGTVVLPL